MNYALRGTDDDAPNSGTAEWNYWISLLNIKKNEIFQDPRNWSHIYEVRSIGTISASTAPSFDLDDDFISPSDSVYVVDTSSNRHDFTLIKPEERSTLTQNVFIAGMNPQVLYFANQITATQTIVSGTLYMPGYWMPSDITANTQTVPLPDPNWGVFAVASEIAFSDITYEDKAETLNAKANNLYMLMTKKNRKGTHKNPRTTPYLVRRIKDTRR